MYPESILRVQELTGKNVTFYEADITNKDSLRQVRKEFMESNLKFETCVGVCKVTCRWTENRLCHTFCCSESCWRVLFLTPEVLQQQRDRERQPDGGDDGVQREEDRVQLQRHSVWPASVSSCG